MASIQQRGPYSYRITVCEGRNGGKKIRKLKTINLDPKLTEKQIEKEVERQAALFEEEVRKGTYLDGNKITFAEFVDKWLKDYAEKELEPKTLFRYKEMLTSRILPTIGHKKLSKLQPNLLVEFYSNLKEAGIRLDMKYVSTPLLREIVDFYGYNVNSLVKISKVSDKTIKNALDGKAVSVQSATSLSKALDMKLDMLFKPKDEEPGTLSSRTVLHHHRLISSILTTAVQWQVILENPAKRLKAPKVEKTKIKHYNEEQTRALLKALDSEELKYKVMVFLDVFSGLRLGELMGLDWSNVDLENNTIEVSKASQHLTGKGTFEKNPKNETSIRKISIPAPVTTLLKEYRVWWLEQKMKVGDLWNKSDRLFVTWDGKPMFTYTLTNWFPDFLKRHNLPPITPHGLRHTSATLLSSQGLEIAAISKRLGHARVSTTIDIYVHALKSADTAASNLLEKVLIEKDNSEDLKHG